MNFRQYLSNSLGVARLGHRGNSDALPIGVLLGNAIIGPLFYVLYFYFVRLGSTVSADKVNTLRTAFLLLPVGNVVFYLAAIFGRMRTWGVLRYALVSQFSLFEFGLLQILFASSITSAAVLTIAIPVLFYVGTDTYILLNFSIAIVLACLSLACVGLFCAMIIISLKDYLVFTNTLFFVVVLTSGVVDDLSGLPNLMLMLNPLRPLVRWLETDDAISLADRHIGLTIMVGFLYAAAAWAASRWQEKRIELHDI